MTKHRIINTILGVLCILILINQCMFEYERLVRNDGLKFIVNLIFGGLSILGWCFITYSFFRVDVYGTVVNMCKAKKEAKPNETEINGYIR